MVRTYCGHGIGELFHTNPTVPHYAKNKAKGTMKPGHIFTIEPMINLGDWQVCEPAQVECGRVGGGMVCQSIRPAASHHLIKVTLPTQSHPPLLLCTHTHTYSATRGQTSGRP